MNQLEFDKEMRRLNELQTQEYKEIDNLLLENHQQQDYARQQIRHWGGEIDTLKLQGHELTNRKREIARKYHEQKRQLIAMNPEAYGTPTEKGEGITKRELHTLRCKLLKELQEKLADVPGIDCDKINVQFKVEGDSISFETIIPKRD